MVIEVASVVLALIVTWLTGYPQSAWSYWRYEREAHRRAIAAQHAAIEQARIAKGVIIHD